MKYLRALSVFAALLVWWLPTFAQNLNEALSSPAGIITAQYLYAGGSSISGTGGVISGFRVDTAGKLHFTGQAFPVREPASNLLQSPFGAKLFAGGLHTIWSFAVTPTTGVLRFVTSVRLPGNDQLQAMAINPQGTLLFTLDLIGLPPAPLTSRLTTYRIGSSGALSRIASLNIAPANSDLAVDPAGRFLYVVTIASFTSPIIKQFRINFTTGALTLVRSFTTPSTVPVGEQLAFHPNGRALYVGGFDAPAVTEFSVDLTSGALSGGTFTAPDCDGGPDFGGPLAVSPGGTLLFEGNLQPTAISEYKINTATDMPSAIGCFLFPPSSSFTTMAIDGTGKFLYSNNLPNLSILAFTTTNGVLTAIAGSPFSLPASMSKIRTLRVLSVR